MCCLHVRLSWLSVLDKLPRRIESTSSPFPPSKVPRSSSSWRYKSRCLTTAMWKKKGGSLIFLFKCKQNEQTSNTLVFWGRSVINPGSLSRGTSNSTILAQGYQKKISGTPLKAVFKAKSTASHCNILSDTKIQCKHAVPKGLLPVEAAALLADQYTAKLQHCNTLQHTATHCNTLQHRPLPVEAAALSAEQYPATLQPYNKLQHTVTHCNTPCKKVPMTVVVGATKDLESFSLCVCALLSTSR